MVFKLYKIFYQNFLLCLPELKTLYFKMHYRLKFVLLNSTKLFKKLITLYLDKSNNIRLNIKQ